MKTLQRLAKEAKRNGFARGQSAKAFAAGNPAGAKAVADFIKANRARLVRELAAIV